MKISRIISYLCILLGGISAIYANAEVQQNQYFLIGGIALLMIGIYRISRSIPSKKESTEDTNTDESNTL